MLWIGLVVYACLLAGLFWHWHRSDSRPEPAKVKPIPNARFLCLHILATTSGFGGVR